ncbi:hypothetical protein BX600DRAFT_500217 [Xylariales sp. PMI_506]|nr:hypothetical protein BX600DRAFT_500217 [Xylariales sp. PMI_506]
MRWPSFFSIALLGFSVVVAQDIPLALTGGLDDATVKDATKANSGGTVSVNGWKVTVPDNLQIGFPATFIPWRDFVASKGSFLGMEVDVVGNIVAGIPYAAQISIAQFSLESNQGFIDSLNIDGSMKIANGPTIRINDPNAVYSAGYQASPFFTADDENPSISSFSGFPMCVPRVAAPAIDPLCPSTNRPNIPGTTSMQGTLVAPNATVMAPFVKGDYISYSGFKNAAGEIVCYSIVASNIQITTTGVPTYIRMEDVNIGIFSTDPNVEIAETKFIGYISDSSVTSVTIYAVDYDICTGAEKLRQVAIAVPKAGDVRNKFDFRVKSQAGDKYAREYLVKAPGGTKVTANGIIAGQYYQPVTEWIQPEQNVPGLAPIANVFSTMTYLTQGLGRDESGTLWGPLSPFPQSGVTGLFDVNSCPAFVPTPTPTTTAATPPATPPATPKDTVTAQATWVSSQSGTLTVRCTSSNTNNALVKMTLDYTLTTGATTSGLVMTASSAGVWTFTGNKIKQLTSVTCTSALGGVGKFTF